MDGFGVRRRIKRTFESPRFESVVESFRQNAYPLRARSTCLQYVKMLNLYFDYYQLMRITEITPKHFDEWLRREMRRPDRDLPRSAFERVRACMMELYGEMWWALFTVQWCEALRISEAAALCWEDVRLNTAKPSASCIHVCRHVLWTRVPGEEPLVESGFKNSSANGGSKLLPVFPEAFAALRKIYTARTFGLILRNSEGGPLTYCSIQSRYARAFAKAGIVYRGTHALRHGGCREIYNRTGDIALAGLLLGNQDNDSIRVYARRDPAALFKFAEDSWAAPLLLEAGTEDVANLISLVVGDRGADTCLKEAERPTGLACGHN